MTLMEERDLVVEAAKTNLFSKNNLFVIKSLPHLALERRKFKKIFDSCIKLYCSKFISKYIMNVIRLLHENDIRLLFQFGIELLFKRWWEMKNKERKTFLS